MKKTYQKKPFKKSNTKSIPINLPPNVHVDPSLMELNPKMTKSFRKMDKIERDMNYIVSNSKNKKCGDFIFKSQNIERSMNKLLKKIEHFHNEIIQHNVCHNKDQKQNELLIQQHQQKKNQGIYLNDNKSLLKKEIEQMRNEIVSLNALTRKYELTVIQHEEEIKYLFKDIEYLTSTINSKRIEMNNIYKQVNEEKAKIFEITKGCKVGKEFVKDITNLITTE